MYESMHLSMKHCKKLYVSSFIDIYYIDSDIFIIAFTSI